MLRPLRNATECIVEIRIRTDWRNCIIVAPMRKLIQDQEKNYRIIELWAFDQLR